MLVTAAAGRVKEFHDEKDYRKRGGPPRATGYENAIRGLEMCTQNFEHPVDMKGKVTGVGPTTIVRLIEKLEAYCERKGIPMPEPAPKPVRGRKAAAPKPKAKAKAADEDDPDRAEPEPAPAKRKRATRKTSVKAKPAYEDDDEEVEEVEPPLKKRARRVTKKVDVNDE